MKPSGNPVGPFAPPAGRYRPGDVIGDKYELVQLLGGGGMGNVWVAHQIVLDVLVAVKLLTLEEDESDEGAILRMLEEARTAARLGHAAIVRVHDFGRTVHGDPYIVLELLEGEDLADLLAREHRLDQRRAVAMLLPIAHALSTAHEHGIVHRDVKPENIFLAKNELGLQPKLLDFGVARFLDRPRKLTLEGALLGTPEYVAPEQAKGKAPSASADLWSFTVVLYELVTGECPFRGQDRDALVRAILEEDPSSFQARGIHAPALWEIVRRGLEKEPHGRYPSMRALGQALADWMLAQGVTEDLTGISIRRTWLSEREYGESSKSDGAAPLPLVTTVRKPAASRPRARRSWAYWVIGGVVLLGLAMSWFWIDLIR
jgi:serine/threonine protein kinase